MLTLHNPLEELRLATLTVYPDLTCDVIFVDFEEIPTEVPEGETVEFQLTSSDRVTDPSTGRTIIRLSSELRISEVLDEMAEQLAEVASEAFGISTNEAVDAIYDAYTNRVASA